MTLVRIHRAALENWRIWDSCSVEGLRSGVVVVSGPNAVGKTSVREAIALGLLSRHWGAYTKRLRPLGTKRRIPRVEVEFDAREGRYRIEKHFGSRDKATLLAHTGGEWTVVDGGEEAYLRCRRAVLGEDAPDPTRGGLDQALKDTLMEVLFPEQGGLVDVVTPPQSVPAAIVDRRAEAAATRLGRVLQDVSVAADRIWVGTRTRPKSGSDVATFEARLEEIDREAEQLKERAARIGELAGRVAAATEELTGMGDVAARMKEAGTLEERARAHEDDREKAAAALAEASRQADEAEALATARRGLAEGVEEADEGFRAARDAARDADDALGRASRELAEARQARNAQHQELDRYRKWLDYERRADRMHTLDDTLARLRNRLGSLDEARQEEEETLREIEGLTVPTEEEWREWDEVAHGLRQAQGRLEAAAWRIEGTVPTGLRLEVDGKAIEGRSVSHDATREVRLTADTGEELRVFSLAPDTEVEEWERGVAAFLERFGVESVELLRERDVRVKQTLAQRLATARTRADAALAGETREDLLREEGRLQGEAERLKRLEEPSAARPAGLQEEWGLRVDLLGRELEAADERLGRAREDAASTGTTATGRAEELRVAESERECATIALAEHREQHGPDAALEESASRAQRERDKRQRALQVLEEEKAVAEDAPRERARRLREGFREVLERQEALQRMGATLEGLRNEDPEGQIAELEAEKAGIEPRLRVQRVHADALLLLERVLQEEQRRHTEVVGGPIKERIERWMRFLLQDQSEVVVGSDGWPRVIRSPRGEEVPYEDQSFGTREQVGVLYRLAVADLLAGEDGDGVCLMLDDPFGHTDRARRRRMLEILEGEAARKGHQILVFTCRPEDFEGVGHHVALG